jgi:predicted enzyme related to lactoylglutathione lyase
MADSTGRGLFVWHDLMTSDPQAAIGFYTKVIGWGTQIFENPKEPYTMWTANGAPVGGVMKTQGGVPPHWLGYISSPDVDATVKQAAGMGATTHVPPTDIPTVGRFAVMMDPQGAAFAVFAGTGGQTSVGSAVRSGEFSWHELMTTDPVAALDFYQKLFGWVKTSAMDMGEMGVYQMFGPDADTPFGGVMKKSADMPAPPNWGHYIKVGDVNRAVETAKAGGAQLFNGPMEVPGGDLIANLMDPQGAAFSVHAAAAQK